MHRPYREYESKWQKIWQAQGTYKAKDDLSLKKFYGLIEFPYPSGEGLHTGHGRPFIGLDVLTRKHRMQGENVLYPIGWDAFGLPTENFAIKYKIKPALVTQKNIANMKRQLMAQGIGFDWSREVNTTDPAYYKWTQWQFLKFFNSCYDEATERARPIDELPIPYDIVSQGELAIRAYRDAHRLAFKATSTINWCPKDKIGLANEEAQGGVCERCGTPVEKREKAQWMLRITQYAERLLEDLELVDYLDKIKTQQRNWIGKSAGVEIVFKVADRVEESTMVFTTRPDTLFGVTYVVMAPEHALVDEWIRAGRIKNAVDVEGYRALARRASEVERTADARDKTGVVLDGVRVINPANNEELPVWISDYVLSTYGTGAVMAVPAHDERDFAFATKFGLPMKQVVAAKFVETENPPRAGKKTKRRKTIHAIIKNPRDKKILLLDWKEAVWGERKPRTFVIGGVEEGEDMVEAALREIHEETGYRHLRFVRPLVTEVHTEYYAAHKDENRQADIAILCFELTNDERDAVSLEEAVKHDVAWVSPEDVVKTINVVDGPFIWKMYSADDRAYEDEGVAINSDFLNDLPTWKAKEEMTSWLIEHGYGHKKITYKLRDWVFSRQHYWGEPIPIVICAACGYVPVPEDQLPLTLPEVEAYEPTDTGESPLSKMREWVEVACPQCGGKAERETDTMPNWAGSSWYFLRYCDPHNDQALADPEQLKHWMPVDLYNGGMEHTTLHLLYSRFWHKFLWDIGAVPAECGDEPYRRRHSHGLILAAGGEKMSKSKGNVVNPDEVIEKYGADAFRVYLMFMGPFEQAVPWDVNGIEGVKRFLDKVWNLFQIPEQPVVINSSLYHQSVKKITDGIDHLEFNTCISQLMILTNQYQKNGGIPNTDMRGCKHRDGFLQLLAPFAPHLAEELWHQSGHADSIHVSGWPVHDPAQLEAQTFELVIQVNGKIRDRLTVGADEPKDAIESRALSSDKIQTWLNGRTPQQIIHVRGKILNIVIS